MARIPVQYTKEITAMPPMPSVQTDIAPIAKGIDFIGQAIGIRAERQREADEQMRKIDVDKEFAAMQTNAKKSKSGSALGLNKEFADRYTPLYEKYVDEIEDPVTRKNMESYFQSKYNRGVDWTRNYVMGEEDAHLAEVDEANRANLAEELSETPIGDLESIFAAADKAVMDVTKREGVQRMTSERQALYHKKALNELFTTQLDRWYSVDPLDTYNWYAQNREKLRDTLSAETFAASEKAFRQYHGEAQITRVHRETTQRFGDDLLGASAYLEDPANFKEIGIKEEEWRYPMQAAQRIRRQISANNAIEAQRKTDTLNSLSKGYAERYAALAGMEDVDERNMAFQQLYREIELNPDLDIGSKGQLLNSLTSMNFKRDPVKARDIIDKIDSREITENHQLTSQIGDGAGPHVNDFIAYKDRVNKDAEAGNENQVKAARKRFLVAATERFTPKQRRGDDRQVLRKEQVDDYETKLKARIKAEGLTPYDPRVRDIADEMMNLKWYVKEKGEAVREFPHEGGPKLSRIGEPWGEQYYPFDVDLGGEEAQEEVMIPALTPTMADQPPAAPTAPAGPASGQPTAQPSQTEPARQKIEGERQFKLFLADPELIPEDAPEAKLSFMVKMLEQFEERDITEKEISIIKQKLGL